MVILYFLGGHDPFLESGVAIMHRAIREAGGNPRVLLLPWGMSREEGEKIGGELRSAFRDLGGEAWTAWPDEEADELKKKIMASDLVFLPDGNPRMMQRNMRFSGMKKMLQEYEGVVVGNAAGASIMCRHVLMPPDEYSSTYTMILGLNMVDFGIIPRYTRASDQYVVESSAGRTVFGIPEGSAVMYGAGILSHSGPVHMFKNGKRTILTDEMPF